MDTDEYRCFSPRLTVFKSHLCLSVGNRLLASLGAIRGAGLNGAGGFHKSR
jgi:hypothetical protein